AGQAASHDLHRRAEPEAADLLPDQVLVEVALEGRVLDVHELAAVEHEPVDVRAMLLRGDIAAVRALGRGGDVSAASLGQLLPAVVRYRVALAAVDPEESHADVEDAAGILRRRGRGRGRGGRGRRGNRRRDRR